MPCNFMQFKLPDGSVAHAIVCSRGSRSSFPCVVCGKPNTKLCDGKPGTWPNIKAKDGTCSAPLCDAHAYHVDPDSDYCPRCTPAVNDHARGERVTPQGE